MSATFDRPSLHPVLACIEAVEAELKETADVAVDVHASRGQAGRPPAADRASRRSSTSLRLRVMAASDDVAQDQGARDVAAR